MQRNSGGYLFFGGSKNGQRIQTSGKLVVYFPILKNLHPEMIWFHDGPISPEECRIEKETYFLAGIPVCGREHMFYIHESLSMSDAIEMMAGAFEEKNKPA